MLGLQLLQILGMLSDSNLREEDDTMGGWEWTWKEMSPF
jgi:hypothetical protein